MYPILECSCEIKRIAVLKYEVCICIQIKAGEAHFFLKAYWS